LSPSIPNSSAIFATWYNVCSGLASCSFVTGRTTPTRTDAIHGFSQCWQSHMGVDFLEKLRGNVTGNLDDDLFRILFRKLRQSRVP
jgi:hypothetical protein